MLKWQWNGKWRKTCHIALPIIVPDFYIGIISSPTSLHIYFFKKHLGSLPTLPRIFWRPYWLMRFLISGIKPTISVTTEIAPKGVGVARNYATSAIKITTLTITFHARWMVLVELAFLLKRQIYTPVFLISKTFIV